MARARRTGRSMRSRQLRCVRLLPTFGQERSDGAAVVDLDRALGPAELLGFDRVDLGRQLGRTDNVGQIDELPALELGAEAGLEVSVLRVGDDVLRSPASVAASEEFRTPLSQLPST